MDQSGASFAGRMPGQPTPMPNPGQSQRNAANQSNIDPRLLSYDAQRQPSQVNIISGSGTLQINTHHHAPMVSSSQPAHHGLAGAGSGTAYYNQPNSGQQIIYSNTSQPRYASPRVDMAEYVDERQQLARGFNAASPWPVYPGASHGSRDGPHQSFQGFGDVGTLQSPYSLDSYPQYGQQPMAAAHDLSAAMTGPYASGNYGMMSSVPLDTIETGGAEAEQPPSKKRKTSKRKRIEYAADAEPTGAQRKLKTLAEIPEEYSSLYSTTTPLQQYTEDQAQRLTNPIIPLNINGTHDPDDFASVVTAKDAWIKRIMASFTANFLLKDPYGKVSDALWTDFQVGPVIQITKLLKNRVEQAEISATNLFYTVLEIHDTARNPNCGPRSIGVAGADNSLKCSDRLTEVIRSLTWLPIMRLDVIKGQSLREYASNPVYFRNSKMKNKKGNDDKKVDKARRSSSLMPSVGLRDSLRRETMHERADGVAAKDEEVKEGTGSHAMSVGAPRFTGGGMLDQFGHGLE